MGEYPANARAISSERQADTPKGLFHLLGHQPPRRHAEGANVATTKPAVLRIITLSLRQSHSVKKPLTTIRYNNVRAEMARQKIGPSKLARLIGREPSQVSQIAGKTMHKGMGDDMARLVEKALGLPMFALDRPETDIPTEPLARKSPVSELLALEPIAPWDSDTPLNDDETTLPLHKEVELAAGHGRTTVQAIDGRVLRFSLATLRMCGVDPEAAICAPVSGNSMSPLILHGTTVGIDTGMTRIVDGEIYALEHDGMLRVKLLFRQPGGGLRIRSFNRDEYPDEDYSLEEAQEQQIRVIGRVFWWSTIRPLKSAPLV